MEKSTISGWIRQARHRAKKHDIYNELEMADVEEIVKHYKDCAYCSEEAETLDHAFPLKDSAPNVAANVLPTCKKCKQLKRSNDLVWMFNNNMITKDQYVAILKDMFGRPGGDELREHVKAITGMF